MATAADLANAAAAVPTIPTTGGMCHDTVMTWLIQAGFVSRQQWNRLAGDFPTPAALFSLLFARRTDTRVTQATAAAVLQPGMIVSFYYPVATMGISHSVATMNATTLAGTNNLNIGGPLGYGQMAVAGLPWSPDGSTVGANSYHMFAASVDDFAMRFAAESASWAQRHPTGR